MNGTGQQVIFYGWICDSHKQELFSMGCGGGLCLSLSVMSRKK